MEAAQPQAASLPAKRPRQQGSFAGALIQLIAQRAGCGGAAVAPTPSALAVARWKAKRRNLSPQQLAGEPGCVLVVAVYTAGRLGLLRHLVLPPARSPPLPVPSGAAAANGRSCLVRFCHHSVLLCSSDQPHRLLAPLSTPRLAHPTLPGPPEPASASLPLPRRGCKLLPSSWHAPASRQLQSPSLLTAAAANPSLLQRRQLQQPFPPSLLRSPSAAHNIIWTSRPLHDGVRPLRRGLCRTC